MLFTPLVSKYLAPKSSGKRTLGAAAVAAAADHSHGTAIAAHIAVPISTSRDNDIHGTYSMSDSGDDESEASRSRMATHEKKEVQYWKEKAAALPREVSLLKDQVMDRNASLEELQEKREQEEKMHGERCLTYEMEIVRLIEMRNKARRSSGLPTPASPLEGVIDCNALQYANLEISALNELLTVVLGERDLLAFRNKNLEALIKEVTNGKCTQSDADRNYRHDEAKGDVVYQLSCKACKKKHNIVGRTNRDLNSKVCDQFHDVWKLVQHDADTHSAATSLTTPSAASSLTTPSALDTPNEGNTSRDQTESRFGETQFAKHIANHCKHATSDVEVMAWCKKNVKVEVLRIRSL